MSSHDGDSAFDLLASLRANSSNSKGQQSSRQSPAPGAGHQSSSFSVAAANSTPKYQKSQPSAMASGFTSPFTGTHLRDSSNNAGTRHNTPGAQSSAQNNLLGLLKFGAPSSSPQPTPQQNLAQPSKAEYGNPSTHSVHGRGISASDLVASFMGSNASTPIPQEKAPTSTSTSHQDSLLKLLNRTASHPETTQPDVHGSKETPVANPRQSSQKLAHTPLDENHPAGKPVPPGRNQSPIRFFGSENATPTPFEPQDIPKSSPSHQNSSIFTYVNPFEQLHASAPRNTKSRSPATVDAHKRKVKSPSPAAVHTSSRRKLTPSGNDVLQSIESPAPEPLNDGRSQIEALMGIGAPSRDAETVAQALNEVGGQVDRQVGNALAEAEGKEREAHIKQEQIEGADRAKMEAIEEHLHDAAVEIKSELDKEDNKDVLRDAMPTPIAEAVKAVVDEAAKGKAADEWESAEGEDASAKEIPSRTINVYQFPMRPFVAIDLVQKSSPNLTIREDSVVNIARFKKDFDQADRTLATATNEFIVYGMPKNGGIRIIQQDNGTSSLIFPNTQDRIFNIAISTSPEGTAQGKQGVIATGISGSVYWTTIAEPATELSQEDMEVQGVIFPPFPTGSDSTSSGQLKTRAKKSSRHPEYFAIGRGKSIHIVFPSHARNSDFFGKASTIDTEKYLVDRSLKISTGKAGKDFTFSEDDSTIVTLDKAGKLRIWDIRALVDEANASASRIAPIENKVPMLTFATAQTSEKSWPTSVMFVDKLRPYTKGIALRYIVVGMKQNHTLQLWDLCLGKAVQELSFPHEKETDAICSVAYHPASGIIVVGHPTRNSIYLIHLSAPKYNLPSMSQARFTERLANKDSTLPKAEATAIMSGMREYSFAHKGQLRSVELVPSSGEATRMVEDDEDPNLFELYVMHSKGVTCLGVKKEDLGWSRDSKVMHPVDAERENLIVVKDLREPSAPSTTEPSTASTNGDPLAPTAPAKATGKTPSKEPKKSDLEDGPQAMQSNAVDKKKNKRKGAAEPVSRAAATPTVPNSYANAAQLETKPTPQDVPSIAVETVRPGIVDHSSSGVLETPSASAEGRSTRAAANGNSINVGVSSDFLDKELKKIEHGVSNEFNKVLGRELDTLYRRFGEDKRVQDAAGAAKQDAMLRLVSSTLGDNVEKALSRIIMKNIQEIVVPSIADVTSTTLSKQLTNVVAQQVQNAVAPAIKHALPEAIHRSMQSPELFRAVSEQITTAVTSQMQHEFSTILNKSVIPSCEKLALGVAHNVSGETERRVRDQLLRAEVQRQNDSAKIDQLTALVSGLSETVHTMAAAQSQFQNEIFKLQPKVAQDGLAVARGDGHRHSPTPSESASMNVSPEQEELDTIATSMHQGRYEEATVMV